MSKPKLASLVVTAFYLLIAYLLDESVYRILLVLGMSLFGLVGIWFGDTLGYYMEKALQWDISNRPGTPPWLIKFVGWVFLLLLPHIPLILRKVYHFDMVLELLNRGY